MSVFCNLGRTPWVYRAFSYQRLFADAEKGPMQIALGQSDICEFESYMPSHAVGSRPLDSARLVITSISWVSRIEDLASRKSVRSFKGIICANISEFESHMPATQSALPAAPPRSAPSSKIPHQRR